MKRSLDSSDSLGALMSICPTTDDHQSPRNNNHVYSREFQSMLDGLDEDGCIEEGGGHISEKKRRLSVDQVKALEKNFEVENKLEPDRKVKLAQELGLQPRQVAVWFQNRRARWKTKQLERDYGVLKANFESLKVNYESLQHDNESLLKEIRELKAKLNKEDLNTDSEEEEKIVTETKEDESNEAEAVAAAAKSAVELDQGLNYESFNNNDKEEEEEMIGAACMFPDFKDGSSDSDSSAILNEDNNNNNNNGGSPSGVVSSGGVEFQNQHNLLMMSSSSSSMKSSPINYFQFSKPTPFQTHHQFVKMEEHNFFGDEACNFFSDEQAPSLPWYCSDQWS